MAVAALLTTLPGLPPMAGFLLTVAGTALAPGLTVSRWCWSAIRDDALAEAAWVAGRSGYAPPGTASETSP